jgi:hypothetical protein
MSNVLRAPNGNGLLLTHRTASHSIAVSAMQNFWPNIAIGDEGHPAWYFGTQEVWDGNNPNVALIVRNPIERFRSICAHHPEQTVDQHLENPRYLSLPQNGFVKHFRFEDQLNDAAEWLGLPTPLPQEDASDPALKPALTAEQEARVRELYAADIALWESLQPSV